MHELIEKILASGNSEALKSQEALQKAAEELGFSADEAEAAKDDFDGFPLDDDDLTEITGGGITHPTHSVFVRLVVERNRALDKGAAEKNVVL